MYIYCVSVHTNDTTPPCAVCIRTPVEPHLACRLDEVPERDRLLSQKLLQLSQTAEAVPRVSTAPSGPAAGRGARGAHHLPAVPTEPVQRLVMSLARWALLRAAQSSPH